MGKARTRSARSLPFHAPRCGSKVRGHWIVPGLVRFNGAGTFNPHMTNRALGETFECADLAFRFGGNRLLFERKHPRCEQPDWHLVVVSEEHHGHIDFATAAWNSRDSLVIAASQLRDMQEVMLLMRADDWVRTSCGFWQLALSDQSQWGARLELVGAQNPASE